MGFRFFFRTAKAGAGQGKLLDLTTLNNQHHPVLTGGPTLDLERGCIQQLHVASTVHCTCNSGDA